MQQQLGKVCGAYLAEKCANDTNVWVLDGDLADSDGAEIFAESVPERFIAGGIAEQNMVSIAAGLASVKRRPWVFSFAAFLCYRAYDQIRVGVSQTGLPVTLIGSHSGGAGGRNGKTHLALNDIAIMASLPNIHIWAPADPSEIKLVIDHTLINEVPAYVRLPRDPQPMIPYSEEIVRWIGFPTSVALISYGLSTHWALEAQKILKENGHNIGVLHFCKVWPISRDLIAGMLKDVQHAFVIEDHYAYGGLATCLQLQGCKANIINWCWPSSWSGQSGQASELLDHCGISPNKLAMEITGYLKD